MKNKQTEPSNVVESILSEFLQREETIKVLRIIAKTNAMINTKKFEDFYREISKRNR